MPLLYSGHIGRICRTFHTRPFDHCRHLLALLLCLAGFHPLTLLAQTDPSADWVDRRAHAQTLSTQAEQLRLEADQRYAHEDRQCYEEILTNQCREKARYEKVRAYQQARKLDIEARRIELAIRQEEKIQKAAERQAAAPEQEEKNRQRIEATERRNQIRQETLEKRRARNREIPHE